MAALVSEYTLEFFTLLNARGKKELIEWCMKEGLIASSYECPKCNEQMGLNERKSVVLDGFEWRCRKKERDFSALKRVKSEIGSTTENEKLNSLMLLYTQNDITAETDCNDAINNFTMNNARRKPLLYKYSNSDLTKNKDVEK
ncbi:uncharacterized protein TNCV_2554341 [Trichonephila clavipes]|nr:uncharacterized protein TNCV_2554341 [Trichonephila clavipes]